MSQVKQWKKRAKSMKPRHCLTAHQPNPAFEGTRVKLWFASPSHRRRAPQRGRWASP